MTNSERAHFATDYIDTGKRNDLKTKSIEFLFQKTKISAENFRTSPCHVQQNVLWYLTSFDNDEPDIAKDDVHCYLRISAEISGLERLRSRCETVLLRHLNVENAIYMLHEGEKHGLPNLQRESSCVISLNLPSIILQPEFLTLEKHQIQNIIGQHTIAFGNEGLRQQIAKIFRQDKVREAKTAKPIKDQNSEKWNLGQPQRQRNSVVRRFGLSFMTNEKHKLQVVVRDFNTHKVYTTNCTNEMGKTIKVSPNFTACVVQIAESDPPLVYVTGGADDNRLTLECDVVRGKWKQRKPMAWGREGHALCTINEKVYAIGGFRRKGGNKHLVQDIEKYHLQKKTWSSSATLETPVYSCATVNVGSKIFIIGGRNADGSEVNKIQVLDTENESISVFSGLPTNCAIGKAVLMDNAIFFASTTGHFIQIDPITMFIRSLEPQPQVSTNFVLFSVEDCLLITYYDIHAGQDVCTYKYMQDNWSSLDRYTNKHPYRVYGHCIVMYPKQILQVPFCD